MAVEDLRWWTGSEWVSVKDFNSDSLPPGTAEGQLLQWDGYGWSPASEGTTSGQLLSWDDIDKRWVPSTALDDYLPLAGGTMTGTISWNTGALINDAYGLANTFSVSTEGSERFRVDSNAVTAKRQFLLQNSVDRNAPALAFGSYKKTGLYLTGVDDFAFANNGVQTFRMYADGRAVFGNGTATPGTTLTVNGPLSVANVSATAMILRPTLTCSSATTVSGFYSHPVINGDYGDWVGVVSGAPTGTGVRSGFYRAFQAATSGDRSTSYYASNYETLDSWAFYQAGTAPSLIPNLQTNLGSESAPAISFNGMTSTGLFSPSTNSIAFSTAGTERRRGGPEGSLGIGVAATSTNQRARFNASITGASSAWEVRATGRVQADVTSDAIYYGTSAAAEAGVTTARLSHYYATSSSVPATVSLQVGFWATSAMTGAAQNHGFRSDMADTGTNYNIYVGGAAPSYFNGRVGFGTNTPDSTIDVEGVATFSFGSASAPSLTFRGTAGTGMFSPATNVFAISTGGEERLRVTAQGQITAAATYYPLVEQDLATAKYVSDMVYTLSGVRYTTADIRLANPTRSLGRFVPPADLATQEDANQAIGDAIAERKIVLPISRAAYDALPVKDPDTLYLITS